MHSNAMKLLVELGAADDPIAACIRESTESGIVIGKLLKPELEATGYLIVETKLNVLIRVEIFKNDKLLGSGASDSASDALVHAVLGYLKELEDVRAAA
jgi:hypothetical protein